jgi:ABC-type glycerol-3-phosphate transport system substrate-binding protein
LREGLQAGRDCPDLARIDATWLPRLARENLLLPAPKRLAKARAWLPEADELASDRGVRYAVPQSLDGLAIIYRPAAVQRQGVPWPPADLDALLGAARTLSGSGRFGLAVRVDGYWFVAFLRAWGVDLPDADGGVERIDSPQAHQALARFAALFGAGGVSPPPPPSGNEADDERRRFRAGELAALVNGPWAVPALQGNERIAVAPFPPGPDGRAAAPRGGQLFIVPKCARDPDGAWRLAEELTAPPLQADWARRFGVVPTSREALASAGELARQFYAALGAARPLPREPLTAELFDDLNPAIAAVVAGDASPAEALSGVRRAWTRLQRRQTPGAPRRPAPPRSTDAGVMP